MVTSLMLFQDRAYRGLMAVDGATTAGPQPQARSAAEDGRARVSCFREECAHRGPRAAWRAGWSGRGRKSLPGRCGIEAGNPARGAHRGA
jgi:hypothetical protein